MADQPNRQEIMRIAARKGYFRASHRYRDDRLRARCDHLVRDNLLFVMPYWMIRKDVGDDPRSARFYRLTEEGRHDINSMDDGNG